MKKTFFQNLIFLFILNVIIKPVWVLGVDRSVQNIVGKESYGLYFWLFNFSFIFNIILDLGITNYNSRIIAQQPSLIKKYLSNVLFFKLVLIAVYFIITISTAYLFKQSELAIHLLLILCANQVLSSLILYLRSNISSMHYFKLDSVLSILDKLLIIILFAILVYAKPFEGEFQIEWFAYAQLLSYGITLVAAISILSFLIPRPTFNINFGMMKAIWKESYPLAILVLLMSIYGKIDAPMINWLLGPNGDEEAGIYAMAYRLMDAANQFGYLFAALLLPIFARMIARGKSLDELVQVSFKTIFIFTFLLAVSCLFFQNDIMPLLYTESSPYAAQTLGIIMFSLIGSSSAYIFGTLLTANRNLRALNSIALVAVIINVGLNYLLIPSYRCVGAAIASVVTQLFVAITQIIIARRLFSLRPNPTLIINLVAYCAAVLLIAAGLQYLPFDWRLQLSSLLILGLLMAFVLRLFEVKKVLSVVKSSGED